MKCENCGKAFKSKLGLELHLSKPSCPVLKRVQEQTEEVVESKPEPRPFKARAVIGGAVVWQR